MKKEPASKNQARRKLLKTLGVSGAVASTMTMPEKWVRPAVDAVLLPAHAQITGPGGYGNTVTLTDNLNPNLFEGYAENDLSPTPSIGSQLLNFLIPPAEAGKGPDIPVNCNSFVADLWVQGQADSQGRRDVYFKLTLSGCVCANNGLADKERGSSILDLLVQPAIAGNGQQQFSDAVRYKGRGKPGDNIQMSLQDGCSFIDDFCGNAMFTYSESGGIPNMANASLCGNSTGQQPLNPNALMPTAASPCSAGIGNCVPD